ncbi:hypothetical protein M2475_002116 [Breznakia sp. PF5-3]|uniref:hypothetical protein n=1 Tax=unclassified Breznakia TaxID=2623764 RepID=UPI0024050A39|nr:MULTISPECIES: hypothetical protein [unclassified Breznakia]MDF9825703.1 hypothetical protein [Breznakia sp. PM6-1]MDF9836535.1 hypothetical protein [Breznakia sp. PF5-3]MDF9838769.1 hypothetical protein [Breznakia sp. PFB2-8]MDF9860795.1 hypothetical protein [Breznakia sp. PH5-24]
MNIKRTYWYQSSKKTRLGDLFIENNTISFVNDDTDYSKPGVRYMSKRARRNELANDAIKKGFGFLKKKATKEVDGFELSLASLENITITSKRVESYHNKGSFYYSNDVQFDCNGEHYKLGVHADEEDFYKELETMLKK